MSLNTYGFVDETYMKPKTCDFDVSVSADDKIIQVLDGNVLLASLSMSLNDNILSLTGKDDLVVAEVELPQSKIISDAYYDSENKQIVLVVDMEDGAKSELTIDVSDLIDIYEGGAGIEVNGNKIGIKISEDSSKYLSADEDGLSINMDSLDETFATDESLKNYATIEMVEDVKNTLSAYATKDDIADMATMTWVNEQGFLKNNDIEGFVDKEQFAELEEKVDNKVDWTTVSEDDRKAIILKNHDLLLGTKTDGSTVNIGMVSKWDKVDLGSATVEINLNGSSERPTYNDEKQIAFVEDVTDFQGKLDEEIKAREEGDALLNNAINAVQANLNKEISDREVADLTLDEAIKKANEDIAAETERAIAKENELEKEIDNAVKYTDISNAENPNRKGIALANHDTILGYSTDGRLFNIAMVSKWDIVDFGTSGLPLNFNVPSGVRPTIQEAGQSGAEANKMAYMSDIEEVNGNFDNYALKDHNHDDVYAKINHNHDGVYAKTGHTHDKLYAKINHNHDDVYSKLDHNHDDVYSKLDHNHDDVYSKLDHNHDDVYAKIDHTHANMVEWSDISDAQNPNRKSIKLNNHDSILGKDSNGGEYNLAMVSKWNKADFGSASLEINLNGKNARPTYNDETELALVSDIDTAKTEITTELNNYVTINEFKRNLRNKQNKLTSGTGIAIDENDVISCTLDTNLFVILTGDTMPENPVNNKIYLIPNSGGTLDNQFTEYLYNNGTWEKLGEFKADVDMSKYITVNTWESEISPVVESKFEEYPTIEDARNIASEIADEKDNALLTNVDAKITSGDTSVKNEMIGYVDGKYIDQSAIIEALANRVTALENRCDHYDKLFAALLEEHGDGTIVVDFYTKEEAEAKFATKEEIANKVDWQEI